MTLKYYICKKCRKRKIKLYASIPDLCSECKEREEYLKANAEYINGWWVLKNDKC